MREIIRRPQAKVDLIDAADYIAGHGGFDASDRFLAATEAAFRQLASLPGLGAPRDYGPEFPGLRLWPVPKFPNHLIFYLATETEIEIVRVLHGSQNTAQIFSPPDER